MSIDISNLDYLSHRKWMRQALERAGEAGEAGEIPVGAVIVDQEGNLIASSGNKKEQTQDPTNHAEMIVIRQASQIFKNWHLHQCTLYVTLEPCPMCAGAIIQARIGRLVYGVDDPKTGSIRTVTNLPDSACSNHRLQVISGILEIACRDQLKAWFSLHRQKGRF
jgi:tRNA(adenine34) deaminase